MMILRCLFFVSLFMLCSCGESQKRKSLFELSEIISSHIEFKDIDSLIVSYWRFFDTYEYSFKYSNGLIKISSDGQSFERVEKRSNYVSELVNLIDAIYLQQTQPIEIKREKLNDFGIADYSEITVSGFRRNFELFKISTSIGEEEYRIEYSSQFKRLVQLLDELILDE